jgi:hypothetical protein
MCGGLAAIGAAIGPQKSTVVHAEPAAQILAQAPTPEPAPEPEPVAPPEPVGPANKMPGDGTFLVGKDIVPGTYRGNVDAQSGCYWSRLRGLSGELSDVVANEIESGPAIVTIKKTDKAFSTKRCGGWELAE